METPEVPVTNVVPDVILPVVPEPIIAQVPAVPKVVYRCATCREDIGEEQVVKQPLDYVRNLDGTISPGAARFALFCKKCSKFLVILDPEAQKELRLLQRPKGR